ncbi:hypothetical protein [Rubellicoccus peritrichatus]|uniref:Uncharacterized protein n=1 Tax=Rubellicoccus peritrichatus TaxID=3080537 RepID=A0AAQ3LCQ4_9BACT|nr:hypothetical protein [Puniceicoccus sp. CR14]WOO41173.1 hypothetical protein RZN69_21340 [Puniceicoccus sp. CR14]
MKSEKAILPVTTQMMRVLDRQQAARRRTEVMLEAICPGHNAADASVAIAWEKIFDHLCDNPSFETSELNTVAGIIQKLSGAYNQIKSLELKLREQELKEVEHEEKQNGPTLRKTTIDSDLITHIEAQIGML